MFELYWVLYIYPYSLGIPRNQFFTEIRFSSSKKMGRKGKNAVNPVYTSFPDITETKPTRFHTNSQF